MKNKALITFGIILVGCIIAAGFLLIQLREDRLQTANILLLERQLQEQKTLAAESLADKEQLEQSTADQLVIAQANLLAAQAHTQIPRKPQLGLLLGIEALHQSAENGLPHTGDAQTAFYESLTTISGRGLSGQIGSITAMEVSPDSRWLATGSSENLVQLWDLKSADPSADIITLKGLSSGPELIAFSSNSQWLAIPEQSSNAIRLWDLTKPDVTESVISLSPAVEFPWYRSMIFTPDGKSLIVSSSFDIIFIWNMETLTTEPVQRLMPNEELGNAVIGVSPDSRWLFASGRGSLFRWDLHAVDISRTITKFLLPSSSDERLTNHPKLLAVSPNGRWLGAALYDNRESTVILLDMSKQGDPAPYIILKEQIQGWIPDIEFSPDSRYFATSNTYLEDEIYRWDLSDDNPTENLLVMNNFGAEWPRAIEFSSDSQFLLAGSWNGIVKLFEMTENLSSDSFSSLHGLESDLEKLVVTSDGKWVIAASSTGLRMWDWQIEKPFLPTSLSKSRPKYPWLARLTMDDHWLVTLNQYYCFSECYQPHGDLTVEAWKIRGEQNQTQPILLMEDENASLSMGFNQNRDWFALHLYQNEEGILHLWNFTASKPISRAVALGENEGFWHRDLFEDNIFFAGNTLIVSMNFNKNQNGQIFQPRIRNLSNLDAQPISLQWIQGSVEYVAADDNGHWLAIVSTIDEQRILHLWDLTVTDPASSYRGGSVNQNRISELSISPDSHWLALADSQNAIIYDLTQTDLFMNPQILGGSESHIEYVQFSQDSRWAITGGTNTQRWDVTVAPPTPYDLVCDGEQFLEISPDRRWLVTGRADQPLCLWDIDNPFASIQPTYLYGASGGVYFSHDSQRLVRGIVPNTSFFNDYYNVDEASRKVQIWDLKRADPNESAVTLSVNDTSVHFSVDNQKLIAPNYWSQPPSIWNLNPRESIDLACETAGRNMTREEWHTYMRGRPYRPTCLKLPSAP